MSRNYPAKWSRSLWVISIAATLICWVVAAVGFRTGSGGYWKMGLGLLIPLCAAPFAVLGYTIVPGHLLIRRLLWNTRIPLGQLEDASYEPGVMKGSIRLFGNGGLYSFTGWFRNSRMGLYRAFVTNGANTVVMKFPGKTIVVSPEAPAEFLEDLRVNGGGYG